MMCKFEFSLWLNTMMVMVLWSSLAASLTQWIDIVADLWLGGWAGPIPSHFDYYASLAKPTIMS